MVVSAAASLVEDDVTEEEEVAEVMLAPGSVEVADA